MPKGSLHEGSPVRKAGDANTPRSSRPTVGAQTDVITEAVAYLLREPYVTPPRKRPGKVNCWACGGWGFRRDWLHRAQSYVMVECSKCRGRGIV